MGDHIRPCAFSTPDRVRGLFVSRGDAALLSSNLTWWRGDVDHPCPAIAVANHVHSRLPFAQVRPSGPWLGC